MSRLPIIPKPLFHFIEGALRGHISGMGEDRVCSIDLRKLTYFRAPATSEGHSRTCVRILAVEHYDPDGEDGFFGRVIDRTHGYADTFKGAWEIAEGDWRRGQDARKQAVAYAEEKTLAELQASIRKRVHGSRHAAKPTTKLKDVRKEMRDIEAQRKRLEADMVKLQKREAKLLKEVAA